MFLRDYEHVGGRLRIDVFKGKRVLILKDFLGGNFSFNDAAKQAIVHKASPVESHVLQAERHLLIGRKRPLTIPPSLCVSKVASSTPAAPDAGRIAAKQVFPKWETEKDQAVQLWEKFFHK